MTAAGTTGGLVCSRCEWRAGQSAYHRDNELGLYPAHWATEHVKVQFSVYGWICPRCAVVHGPHVDTCPCLPPSGLPILRDATDG